VKFFEYFRPALADARQKEPVVWPVKDVQIQAGGV